MSTPAKARFDRLFALYRSGALAEAQAGVEAALKISPKDPNLLHLAAQVAEALGERERAILFYRRAVAAHSGWLAAEFNLARVLHIQGEREEALARMTRLSQQHPQMPQIWEGLAKFRQHAEQLPSALTAWKRLLELAPDHTGGRAQYLLLARQLCDWSVPLGDLTGLSPQAMTVLTDDPLQQREAAVRYAKKWEAVAATSHPPHVSARAGRRIRLGYLSSDFHAHATAWLMAELFSLHDRSRFEIFVYSYGVEDHSPIRARIRNAAEHFIELNAFTAAQAAERIRQDHLDILIDLKGYTRGARPEILAHRPAPYQIHWLGYPGTMGADFIDAFIGDPVTLPEGSEAHFTEKLIRLPHCYQINDRQRAIGEPLPRAAYGLPETGFVFASFNQTYKLTPEIFGLWCGILREVPEAVLWLYQSNIYAPDSLRRVAEREGVDPARLIFAPPCQLPEHLARYAHVDLALDTFPVGGHTTTSDALWAGTPVVTLTGRSFVARVATSLLHAVELPHLATATPEAYQQRVLDLVRNPSELAAIKEHLRSKRQDLPLFDTPRFVRALEYLLLDVTSSP